MKETYRKEKELLIRYGSAVSEAMFDFHCHFFRLPDGKGMIAYRIENECAVIIGDPICPGEETLKLTEAFHQFCQASNLPIIYVTVSEKFAGLIDKYTKIAIGVCEELIIDPQMDPTLTSHRLQHRIEKAKKHGLTFHEYIPVDETIEKALTDVGIKWEASIKGPHISLGSLNFFESYLGKRWFYVKDRDQITSMVVLCKLEAHEGWLLKFLATLPNVCHETTEFLMISLLDTLRKENCRYLSKGMLPVDHLRNMKGLNYASQKLLQGVYVIISKIFKFKKRKEYWQRYHPSRAPAYLVLTHPQRTLKEIIALKKVFKAH